MEYKAEDSNKLLSDLLDTEIARGCRSCGRNFYTISVSSREIGSIKIARTWNMARAFSYAHFLQ